MDAAPSVTNHASTPPGATATGGVARPRPSPARRWQYRHRDALWAAAMLAPAAVAIVVLRAIPLVDAVKNSLYKALPGGLLAPTWTGLGNYRTLFGDPNFRATLVRTVLFNVIINPLQILVALLVAVLFVQRVAGRGAWRTLVFVPCTVPIVGSSIAWGAALQPQGPVNSILHVLGIGAQPFFTSPHQALAGILLVASWIGIGYWMLFLIAGLRDINPDMYEAAHIDAASAVQTFFRITIPLLKRPLLFVLVADTVANFVLFVPIQLLTNGGPQSSTTLLMFDAYQTTYSYGSANQGAAEIVILSVIMLIIVGVQFSLLREDSDR